MQELVPVRCGNWNWLWAPSHETHRFHWFYKSGNFINQIMESTVSIYLFYSVIYYIG